MPLDSQKSRDQVIRKDGRYPVDAFEFLAEGMTRAVKTVYGDKPPAPGANCHVTGKQVCLSLRELALERWGFLAKNVLTHWNIRTTLDFGQMVYLMINSGFMHKTDEDSLEDFRNVFSFEEAFAAQDCFELKE